MEHENLENQENFENEDDYTPRVPLWVKFSVLGLLFAVTLGFMLLPDMLERRGLYRLAEENREARNYLPALKTYLLILDINKPNNRMAFNALETAIGAQQFEIASFILQNHIDQKKLSNELYERFLYIDDLLHMYQMSQAAINELILTYDEEIIINGLYTLVEIGNIDLTTVYFLLSTMNDDPSDSLKYMRLSTEQNPVFTWTLAYYGNELRRAGNNEEAKQIYEYALSKNASDALAMRGLSVLKLLDGEYEEGLRIIKEAHEVNPDMPFVNETYVIALNENGKHEEARELFDELVLTGVELEENLFYYMDGNLTLTEYFYD